MLSTTILTNTTRVLHGHRRIVGVVDVVVSVDAEGKWGVRGGGEGEQRMTEGKGMRLTEQNTLTNTVSRIGVGGSVSLKSTNL